MAAVARALTTAAKALELTLAESQLNVSHVVVDQLESVGQDVMSNYREDMGRLIAAFSEATAALETATGDETRCAPTRVCFLAKFYKAYGEHLSNVLNSIQCDLANVPASVSALPNQLQRVDDELAEARRASVSMSNDVKELLGFPSVLARHSESIKSDSDVLEVDERQFLLNVDGSSVDQGLESLETFMDTLQSTTSELERCMQCLELFASTALNKVRRALGGPIGYLVCSPPAATRVLATLVALNAFDFKQLAGDLRDVMGKLDATGLARVADSVHAFCASAKKEVDSLVTVLENARQVELGKGEDKASLRARSMSLFSNHSRIGSYFSIGKASRGADNSFRYKIGDIIRGMIYKRR